MKAFFKEKKRSAGYARDRMKLLLISERIDCSPQMMKMLRNDMIHTVKKYLTIDEEQVKIQITQEPAVLHAYIPVLNKKDIFYRYYRKSTCKINKNIISYRHQQKNWHYHFPRSSQLLLSNRQIRLQLQPQVDHQVFRRELQQ